MYYLSLYFMLSWNKINFDVVFEVSPWKQTASSSLPLTTGQRILMVKISSSSDRGERDVFVILFRHDGTFEIPAQLLHSNSEITIFHTLMMKHYLINAHNFIRSRQMLMETSANRSLSSQVAQFPQQWGNHYCFDLSLPHIPSCENNEERRGGEVKKTFLHKPTKAGCHLHQRKKEGEENPLRKSQNCSRKLEGFLNTKLRGGTFRSTLVYYKLR